MKKKPARKKVAKPPSLLESFDAMRARIEHLVREDIEKQALIEHLREQLRKLIK